MDTRNLTDLEQRVLAFEAKWEGRAADVKAAAARREFGWTGAGYELKLQALLREPAALRFDAMLVNRAIRVREERAHARASRTFLHAV